jgi:radical SAM superfamily enzyme YgiQ (UPF0313 family)
MKILILNPPFLPKFSRSSRSPAVTKGGTLYYPYFLAYACGFLEKNGFNVKLIDAVAREWTHEQTVKFAKEFNPSLIVIDTSTPSIYNDVNVGEKIKNVLPDIHIALVGTHPTALPEQTLQLSEKIDSICRGEYDYTVGDLAQTIEENRSLDLVDGLTFRNGKKIKHNKQRKLIENLDELPFVSEVYKKHLNIRDYFYASLRYPQVTILTARGCPYNCSFCNTCFKNSYRTRSIENVVDEFEYIQNEMPEVKEVMIEDDTFPALKKRTIGLCNLMMKRTIKLKWSANARVNTDFETLKKIKKAGCRLLCVGFESPEQNVLDAVNKRTTKKIQIDFMRNVRKAGLLVHGCFILGLPNDTKETIKKTIDFSKELDCDTVQFYPLMVYPGTEAYEWAKSNNYLITENYSKWLTPEGLHNTLISKPGLTNKDLVELCDKARKEFYLRPTYIVSKLKQMITHPKEVKRITRGGKIFYKYLLRGSFGKEFEHS